MDISITDDENKRFFNIINKVIDAEMQVDDPKKIKEVLNEMIDYAWDHFKVEEACMLEFEDPDYKQHKEEHLSFVLKTIRYYDQIDGGDYQILNEIREYLKRWLVDHIHGLDRKYV
ncbi:MAG: hemerythrin family protein [Candidatus Scalindua sp.]|nr:hemerythrin family protein [Candidatus Scalindua sp.]